MRAQRSPVPKLVVSWHAVTTQCPVLIESVLSLCCVWCGTDRGYAATRCAVRGLALLTRAVLIQAMLPCDVQYWYRLCCYVTCGTVVSYDAMRCAVLTQEIGIDIGYA
eukprot:2137713-Rhodomonas_salina.2